MYYSHLYRTLAKEDFFFYYFYFWQTSIQVLKSQQQPKTKKYPYLESTDPFENGRNRQTIEWRAVQTVQKLWHQRRTNHRFDSLRLREEAQKLPAGRHIGIGVQERSAASCQTARRRAASHRPRRACVRQTGHSKSQARHCHSGATCSRTGARASSRGQTETEHLEKQQCGIESQWTCSGANYKLWVFSLQFRRVFFSPRPFLDLFESKWLYEYKKEN